MPGAGRESGGDDGPLGGTTAPLNAKNTAPRRSGLNSKQVRRFDEEHSGQCKKGGETKMINSVEKEAFFPRGFDAIRPDHL